MVWCWGWRCRPGLRARTTTTSSASTAVPPSASTDGPVRRRRIRRRRRRGGDGSSGGDGPTGNASASLSVAGGRLVSADGKVILEIPRGALTRPSEVAIVVVTAPAARRAGRQLRDPAGGRGAGQAGAAELPLHRGRAGRQPPVRPAGGALRRRALERRRRQRQRRGARGVRRHQPLRHVRHAAGCVRPLSGGLHRRHLQVRRPRQPGGPGVGQVCGPGQRLPDLRARL